MVQSDYASSFVPGLNFMGYMDAQLVLLYIHEYRCPHTGAESVIITAFFHFRTKKAEKVVLLWKGALYARLYWGGSHILVCVVDASAFKQGSGYNITCRCSIDTTWVSTSPPKNYPTGLLGTHTGLLDFSLLASFWFDFIENCCLLLIFSCFSGSKQLIFKIP